MRKLLILATTVLLSAGLFSCGGGGGGGISNTSQSKDIVTNVIASVVKGATVCVKDTNNCAQTNDNGTAVLKVSSLPVNLEVKIGNIPLGTLEADSQYVPITPLDLANGDNQTAEKIGAFIHSLVGDITGNEAEIDLSNVEINATINKPLVEVLKTENSTLDIQVKTQTGIHYIKLAKNAIKCDDEDVSYDISKLFSLREHHKRLGRFVKFLLKYNGKTVVFNDPEEQNSTCVLHVNPDNPLQFKFTDCSNPDDNDETWENAYADESGVKVVDEDGATAYIVDVDVEDGKAEYKVQDDNGTWITGWMEVQENQQSEEEVLSTNPSEVEESEENGVVIKATKPFFPSLDEVKSFLIQHNGETVNTSDGGMCKLTYNDGQDEFLLSNCSDTKFPEGTYKIYSTSDYPDRAFIKTPDNDDDVFFFEDDVTLCTSDGCIYVGDEPSNAWEALGDWKRFDVAKNSPDLVAKFCVYFGKDGLYYPEGDTSTKLANYDVNGNLITFTNGISDFDILSMKVFRISNVNGRTYVLTHTKWKDDEGLEIFEKVSHCDNK